MSISSSLPLILASASPRRKELLHSVGLKFKIQPASVDEKYLSGESPQVHVKRLARNKANAVARKRAGAWVLGADTIVVIDGSILGKPKNRAEAQRMLALLSGREHKVFTGFSVICLDFQIEKTKVVQSTVKFKTLSAAEIKWYTGCTEPYDKAGGYAAQEKGASFIQSIRGSYTNVIGLPLCEVLEELQSLKAIIFR